MKNEKPLLNLLFNKTLLSKNIHVFKSSFKGVLNISELQFYAFEVLYLILTIFYSIFEQISAT